MIAQLEVQDYKCIRQFNQPLTPLCVFVGPNDSGKTSLMDSIEKLAQTAVSPLHDVFSGDDAI